MNEGSLFRNRRHLIPKFTGHHSEIYVDRFRNLRHHECVLALFPRWIEPCVAEALQDTPGLPYLSLDDELTLLSAREDHLPHASPAFSWTPPFFFNTDCATARRATGTRKGEQLT